MLAPITAATASAVTIIGRAARRLLTAEGGIQVGDVEGALAASYDAYRMAAEALLIRQGLRATGGDGSHVAVEDALSAQYTRLIPGFAKPTFRAPPTDAPRRAVLRPVDRDQRRRLGVGAVDGADCRPRRRAPAGE